VTKKSFEDKQSPKIWGIAIVLNDNDFGMAFSNLLYSVLNLLGWMDQRQGIESLKQRLTQSIVSGIAWHYESFQNEGEAMDDNTKDYLFNRRKIKILFNEEAFDEYKSRDHDSGAWYLDVLGEKVYFF